MSEMKLIKTWEDLSKCKSDTHEIEIDLYYCNGWIRPKDNSIKYVESFMNDFYLSTHAFYETNHERSTEVLQKCGFDIKLKSHG